MINVLGDALAAGIMAHLCRKDFEKAAPTAGGATDVIAPTIVNNGGSSKRVRRHIGSYGRKDSVLDKNSRIKTVLRFLKVLGQGQGLNIF